MIYRNETKFLTLFFAVMVLFLNGCAGEINAPPVKETDVVVQTPSPAPSETAADAEMKKAVEDNLKKKNITTVTVEVKGGEVTLKGVVSADKYADTMFAAKQVTEKVQNLVAVK